MNIILTTDSYKVTHWKQYPSGITGQYSYFEARGGIYESTLFFGLQYYLRNYLVGKVIDEFEIDDANFFFEKHFGTDKLFNWDGWEHILKKHGGKLPIEIKAVLEGTVVPTSNVLFTVENTCPEDFWLVSYLETLLEKVWYPTTVATRSFELKKVIKHYLDVTGDDIPDFKLHDFGYRGSTSEESAGLGGSAHLINFKGSDTLAGIVLAKDYYHADMPGSSIPAAEHSTITSWGRERETDAYRNILKQFPEGLVAVVSDSYNIFNAVSNIWGGELRDLIINRKGTLVIRPDSGNATEVISRVLNILGNQFGYETNNKGYRILPKYIRLIQGDGIDGTTLLDILETVKHDKWSVDNIAFGSGGGLLQKLDRDTLGFAYKTSNVTINGKDISVSKNPITDSKKKSKEGKLALVKLKVADGSKNEEMWMTIKSDPDIYKDELKTVFKDGELLIDQNFTDIRERAEITL